MGGELVGNIGPRFGRRQHVAAGNIDLVRQGQGDRVAGVGHCMVFSFTGPRSAACLLDVGNIPTGRDLGIAYSGHFHQADPNRDAVFEGKAQSTPIVLPTFARRMYSNGYRKIFFDDSDIVDKFASAIWIGDTCFYVNFYQITSQGRFSREQIARRYREIMRRLLLTTLD